MKLNVVKTIEENIIKVNITVDELGTNSIDATEEKEQLHDFPKKIAYKDIEFKANMKLDDNGDPIVTVDSPDASTIAEVELELINKEFVVDENLITSELSEEDINKLIGCLKNFYTVVTETNDFSQAQVCAGHRRKIVVIGFFYDVKNG